MKKIFKNIVYLSTVKGADLIVPLLIMPYIIRVLGLEQYGIFSLALLYFNFLVSFSDFGQSLIAIKDIARTDDPKRKYTSINKCVSTKFMLSGISIVIIIILTLTIYPNYILVAIAFCCGLIFESFSMSFYFQAEQDMKKISLIQLASRLISTLPVFIFVNDADDLVLYCFLHITPYVLSSTLILISFKKAKLPGNFSYLLSKENIFSGWKIYSYQMINGLILPLASTFLAACYDVKAVAIFAVIQRVLSSIYRVFEPSVIALYPYLASLYKCDRPLFVARTRQIQLSFLFILFANVLFLIYLSDYIQRFIVGHVFTEESRSLYIVMMCILIPMVMNLVMTRILVIIGFEGAISKIIAMTSLVILAILIVVYIKALSMVFVGVALLIGYFSSMLAIAWLLNNGIKNEM